MEYIFKIPAFQLIQVKKGTCTFSGFSQHCFSLSRQCKNVEKRCSSKDFFQPFVENVDEFKNEMTYHVSNIWITNFSLAVDTFFVLSATLSAYSKASYELLTVRYWIRFYGHRLLRLWPAYIVTIALATFWLSFVPTYPIWPSMDPSLQCRQYWWHNVFFLNSIFGSQCIGWTW
ncbi:unnamed protein product [Gongylonema pulchrum]|uniref:Acyl_transf_3 domain-containing protein n=1 Tax=Gongylonema pulchrum TaxID=637853 RepID=A0A183CVF1_9BILA|nr:unnamed protein product [Gongylonema pulchrum]